MDVAEAVSWPAGGPSWVRRLLLAGLIGVVPLLGQLVLLGWMLEALDNLRAGRRELPAPGLRQLRRGGRLFVVMLAYALAFCLAVGIPLGLGAALLSAAGRGAAPLVAAAGFALLALSLPAALGGLLFLSLCQPQVVLATDRGGIRAGSTSARCSVWPGRSPRPGSSAGS